MIPRIPCLFFLSPEQHKEICVTMPTDQSTTPPPPQIILFDCPSLAYSPISKTTSIFNKCQTCPDDICPLYLSAFECKSELAPCPEFVEECSFVPYKGLSKMHLQEWEINRVVCDSSCGDSRFLQLHTRQKMRGEKKHLEPSLVLIYAPFLAFMSYLECYEKIKFTSWQYHDVTVHSKNPIYLQSGLIPRSAVLSVSFSEVTIKLVLFLRKGISTKY